MHDDNLMGYRLSVRSRIEHNNSGLFRNPSPKHAQVVISELVAAARESICIYCGKLSSDIYGNLDSCFRDAIDRGVNVRVMIEEERADHNKLSTLLCERKRIRQLSGTDKGQVQHFVLVDEKRYRIEVNNDSKQALVCAAACDESTSPTARNLGKLFCILWNNYSTNVA